MKTANEIIESTGYYDGDQFNSNHVKEMMRDYAIEVLRDFDNWKAHKTPNLVEQYIEEKGL